MNIPHDPVALEEHFKDDDEGPVSNQGYMPYLNKFILDKVSELGQQLRSTSGHSGFSEIEPVSLLLGKKLVLLFVLVVFSHRLCRDSDVLKTPLTPGLRGDAALAAAASSLRWS